VVKWISQHCKFTTRPICADAKDGAFENRFGRQAILG